MYEHYEFPGSVGRCLYGSLQKIMRPVRQFTPVSVMRVLSYRTGRLAEANSSRDSRLCDTSAVFAAANVQ